MYLLVGVGESIVFLVIIDVKGTYFFNTPKLNLQSFMFVTFYLFIHFIMY